MNDTTSSTKKKNSRKRLAAFALVALGVAGLGSAAASQLAVNTGRDVVSGVATQATGCDTAVTLTYNVDTATISADGSLPVKDITIADIDGCNGATATVYILDADGKQIATGTAPVNGASLVVPVTGTATSHNVAKLAVAIA